MVKEEQSSLKFNLKQLLQIKRHVPHATPVRAIKLASPTSVSRNTQSTYASAITEA